jgi:cell division inhibitor SepF
MVYLGLAEEDEDYLDEDFEEIEPDDPRGMDSRGVDPRVMDPRATDPRGVDPRGMDEPLPADRSIRRIDRIDAREDPIPVTRRSPDRPVEHMRHVAPTPLRRAPVAEEPPPYRIATLQPRSYSEARQVGEEFREGTPVIMNLTEMDDVDAKRLVDFAAGLIFGLHGKIERVTNKVFLLTPNEVDVTDTDKRRIAEGGFYNQS